MEKNNFSKIIENSKTHISKAIYTYLFMLTKYIFLWKNGINKEKREQILKKLNEFTEKINRNIIKKEEKFIKIEPLTEVYTPKNFKNIINFIQKQNSMFAGDIMEGILIMIISYSFEASKTNEFGKYIYVNMAKLRDVSSPEFYDWFRKAKKDFQNDEMKDIKKLLNEDYYVNDIIPTNYKFPLIHSLLTEITKLKFNLIKINNGENKALEYINRGQLELIQYFLNKYRSMRSNMSNLSMIDKDFMGNSIAFIFFHLFEDPKAPPIKLIRCFLTSIYIYYQNEHSPLMKCIEPYKPKGENDDEFKEIPFTYSLKGAFVEGRFANTIISPIKLEPRISHINFGQNNIREWGLFELGKSISMNKNIKSLILKISLLRTCFLDYFIYGFSIYDNYSIEVLNLSMNYLKEDCGYSLANLLSHLKNLKILNLSANEYKGGAKYIFTFLKNQYRKGKSILENLCINNSNLDDSSFYELGELLKSKYCKLKKLSIGANTKSNVINFLKKIKFNRSLEEFNLSKCGFNNKDIDDLCRIISNTNIKQLNLYKNDFSIFDRSLNIVFRTKLVQKKGELNKNKKYVIDRSSSLMTLDLSNNPFYALNLNHINLIKELVQDNSTVGCLDLSHIFFGPYPDRNSKPKTQIYRNAIEKDLCDILKKRKDKFLDLYHKKIVKEVGVERYEKKKEEEKLKLTEQNIIIINKIKNVLLKPINLDLKNENNYSNKNQRLYLKKEIEEILDNDSNYEENKEKTIDYFLDYTEYVRDKEELDKYNLELGEKNLILI